MQHFPALLINEIEKLKRTLALLLTVVMPLSVVALGLMFLFAGGNKRTPDEIMFYLNINATWGMLVLPMFVAIASVLVHHIEHRSRGWQRLHVLPVTRTQIYFAKLFSSLLLLLIGTLSLLLLSFIGAQVLKAAGLVTPAPDAMQTMLLAQGRSLVAILGVLVIQNWLAMRWSNFVPPLAVAVAGTLSIMTVAQSEKYWKFDPWAYGILSANATNPEIQIKALLLSLLVAAVVTVIGLWDIRRRESYE